jgi:hypothetical protein
MDCSGAVSAALGIDPRVSGDFVTWGSPGDGGSRRHDLRQPDARPDEDQRPVLGHLAVEPRRRARLDRRRRLRRYLSGFTARHMAGTTRRR